MACAAVAGALARWAGPGPGGGLLRRGPAPWRALGAWGPVGRGARGAAGAAGGGGGGLEQLGGFQSLPSPKELEKVVKLELLRPQGPEEIARIWSEFHADESKGRVGAVISSAQYAQIHRHGPESPVFVLPVPKPEGYVTMLVQFQLPIVMVTTLDDYRTRGVNAASHLVLTHYTELASDKNLVLVRGDVLVNSAVNVFEARDVIKKVHHLYSDPTAYAKWPYTFNHNSTSFSFTDYLAELGFKK